MKKALLITCALFTLATQSIYAQTTHPISTAFISPNPVEAKAELLFTEVVEEEITVVVKDLSGKVIYQTICGNAGEECISVPLELEALIRGIYILQVSGSSGKVKTLRFQKS
ncbi:MAG: T9SS type A sorting domain-containing protein [Flavobacteriales bacterium]|nr:T9SS type A sorting domain-containing protein [Flavobacteriales bacterium]